MLSLPYPHLHKTEEPALSTTWKDLHQLGVRGTEFSCVNALRLGDLLAVLVTSSLINTLPSDRSWYIVLFICCDFSLPVLKIFVSTFIRDIVL